MKKENWYKLLYIIGTLLVVGFILRTTVDYVRYDGIQNSAPFYTFALIRALEFLLPASVAFVLACILKK